MVVRFQLPNSLDNLVEDVFSHGDRFAPVTFPAVDVTEYDHESVVVAELPGVKKEDVSLKFEDGILTISGERKPYEIPENARILLNEVRVREFNRSIEFGHDIDANGIAAELTNGILRVTLPKAATARPRTIEVK